VFGSNVRLYVYNNLQNCLCCSYKGVENCIVISELGWFSVCALLYIQFLAHRIICYP
jgi:hypothetical protein